MHGVRSSAAVPAAPDFLSDLPFLRRAVLKADRAAAAAARARARMAAKGAGRLDAPRPPGGRAAPAGQAAAGAVPAADWPGRLYGVRQPEPQETPLSWAEVHFARRWGLL